MPRRLTLASCESPCNDDPLTLSFVAVPVDMTDSLLPPAAAEVLTALLGVPGTTPFFLVVVAIAEGVGTTDVRRAAETDAAADRGARVADTDEERGLPVLRAGVCTGGGGRTVEAVEDVREAVEEVGLSGGVDGLASLGETLAGSTGLNACCGRVR